MPAKPSDDFLAKIDHEFARRHLILSAGAIELSEQDNSQAKERLWICDRTRAVAAHNVGVKLGRVAGVETRLMPGGAEALAAEIDRAYEAYRTRRTENDRPTMSALDIPHSTVEGSSDLEHDLARAVRDAERDLLNTHGKAPAVRLVDLVLFEAAMRGASDVHIQPTRDRTLVRYRLDGALHTVRELPVSIAAGVTSRVKVMGQMDVAEQRAPQDGRATVTIGSANGKAATSNTASSPAGNANNAVRRVDLRISTIPSTYGERIVLRLLDASRSMHTLNFASLGIPDRLEDQYKKQICRTSGIVLSTGPTGSGKTTTLYTSLAWITRENAGAMRRGCELNMLTVEDPVEYDLASAGLAISQTQVDPKKNVTFATGLRHILRQDPDVIMVGEIRDQETARIAVQAALTGHLVLSTLHTNDAPSAVARLMDLGVEPFLVASSLSAVLAQRLVRRVHEPCAGKGCDECLHAGFRGRMGVFELLVLDADMKQLIMSKSSAIELKAAAMQRGMIPLKEAGMDLVRRGVTTAQEVSRVIEAVDEEDVAA